jgi:hypothetical protein
MRELQKTFHPDLVHFRVRKEKNGMSKVQKPKSQAADLLLSNGDIQEKLGLAYGNKQPSSNRMKGKRDTALRRGQ